MIPILYNEKEVKFETNGIGFLTDAISCIVSEERNGAYELEMQYPIDGIHYSELKNDRIILCIHDDKKDTQPFVIYSIKKQFKKIAIIRARHITYRLSDIPTKSSIENTGCFNALLSLKDNAVEDCPFEFWSDNTTVGTYRTPYPSSIRSRLGGTQGSILDVFGGEYEWDMFTVKNWKQRGEKKNITIRYGKNLIDVNQEESIENTITGILPYWYKEVNDEYKLVEGNVIYSENADLYPNRKTATIDFSGDFENEPSIEQLEERANRYINTNNIGVPKVNLKVKFVALWQTEEYKDIASLERVSLCDTISIYYERLGINATAKVTAVEYNVLSEKYNEITLGEATSKISDKVVETTDKIVTEIKKSKQNVSEALDNATKRMTGVYGGNIVIHYANDMPYEIMIMDTESEETAQYVIRANYQGIGFSQNGVNGTFTSAWSIGGTMDMQNINVVNLIADMIQGGTLRLGSKENQSGVLELRDNANTLIGRMDENGLKMYGEDGSYVVMNNQVGFAGYDREDNKIYWVSKDEFHMKKSVIEEEITLCNKMRFIPITLKDDNGVIVTDGIGLVSTLN